MKNERSKKHRVFQFFRIAVQAGFFFLFFTLLAVTHYPGSDYIGPVERFFHFNPLLGLTTFIAVRVFFASFLLAGITLAVTIILGRVACGWVCPLGALHQFFSFLFKKARLLKPKNDGKAGLAWKYGILVFVLAGSLFTLNLVGILDPLSFLYRSFTLAVFPLLALGAGGILDILYGVGWFSAGRDFGQFVENQMFNAIFMQGLFLGVLFAGAIMLNAWKERFWCRYLCPLGALLGVFSRWNIFKLRVDDEKCIKCGLCNIHCETQATPFPNEDWKSSECVYCQTCAAICPTGAIRFPIKPAPAEITGVDLSRRKLVLTTFLGLAAAPLFRITPARARASEKLIRPPGSLPEEEFLRACVKCGMCMKVCPTNGLQPALSEAGPEGIWTPMLVPRIGYCEYYCSLCTQVCPTGAIRELTVEEKLDVRIGTAWVDRSRCIPYVFGKPCIVCEEHCPTSPKAIKLVEVEAKLPDGSTVTQMGPVIDLDLCVGCGVCENTCPVMDKPAIFVTSVGEERSSKNQLLLELF